MGYAERRTSKGGVYYRGRYKFGPGTWGTVADEHGETIRFRTKRDAEQAANDREAEVRNGKRPTVQANGKVRFTDFASRWFAAQDLAESTLEGYKLAIEAHLLGHFGEMDIDAIAESDVAEWEAKERAAGYADSSVRQWRKILHIMLQDATEPPYNLIERNPATKRRGRGRVTGRASQRGPEKVITDALGALLLAERAALLTGRDDEFVLLTTKFYTGARWAELVGLEPRYVRDGSVRIEWQLYELTSSMTRVPPKDASYRTIDTPPFVDRLLSEHIAHVRPVRCDCHNLSYVFRGAHAARSAPRGSGATLADVAKAAGVSTGTVSNVLNHPERVAAERRVQVEAVMAKLGFTPGSGGGQAAPHWRRNGFAMWVFQPAATGWYPAKSPHPERLVPVVGKAWPGVPVRGRNAYGRADACWLPLAKGLTPHGLRHSHRTLMLELGTPPVLMDERLGHADGSVQGRYSHVTREMRDRLMSGLTATWEAALDARLAMHSGSQVAVLDRLLRERAAVAEDVGTGGRVLQFARAR